MSDNPTHKFTSWDKVPMEKMSDLISRKMVVGEKAMIAQIFLKKGAVVPLHQHDAEQITYILEGALKFELEGTENRILQSRRRYNEAVQQYNTDLSLFPANVVASMAGFQREDAYFKTEPGARTAPKVQF